MTEKICKNCNYCKKFYEIFWYRYLCFNNQDVYCTAFEKLTERKYSCENWVKKKNENEVSLQRLVDAEKDIQFLLEHLEDIKKQFSE